MNEELKELASLVLLDAFQHEFNALADKFMRASEGLDLDLQSSKISDTVNVYRHYPNNEDEGSLNIWTQNKDWHFLTTGHGTIVDALEFKYAVEVYLCGKKVFEKHDGKWDLCDENH